MNIDLLYSSSEGNACRIFNSSTSVLIDCGVTKKALFANGAFPVDAVFVSHAHIDHLRGVGVIGRATRAPIYIQKEIFEYRNTSDLFNKCELVWIEPGEVVGVGDFVIYTHETSHDSIGGLYFVVKDKHSNCKYGHITDTGYLTDDMIRELKRCDALLVESNYDERMLEDFEEYPYVLKRRIRSRKGHLSNIQTMDFIRDHLDLEKMRWIVFGHLSPRTNTPDTVMKLAEKTFPEYGDFHVAPVVLTL